MSGLRGPIVISGTDTGVGKTIVTAAIAAAATVAGLRVAVVKPCQTGIVTGEEADADVVSRLAAPEFATTMANYPEPLAPTVAARLAGLPTLELDAVVDAVRTWSRVHDVVLLEGAGGVLVGLGSNGWTVIDLAMALSAPVVLVVRPGLGTLNHTALTRLALSRHGIRDLVVLGSWPREPELVHRTNLAELPGVAGAVAEGAGALSSEVFRARAAEWLNPELHGNLDIAAFTATHRR